MHLEVKQGGFYQMQLSRMNWLSYFVSGAVALFLAWALEGCRFGNNVDTGAPPTASFTGYYLLKPARLTFCTVLNKSHCEDSADLTQIPVLLAQVLSNPVSLIVKNPSTGEAYFRAPSGKATLITTLDSQGKISLKGSTPEDVFWQDTACTMHIEVTEEGLIDKSTGQGVSVSGSPNDKTSGRIQMDVMVLEILKGICKPDLTFLAKCYDDATAATCGGSSDTDNQAIHLKVVTYLKPYIDARTITTAELPDLTGLGYQVSYR